MAQTMKRQYGWRPDKPDFRDHLFLRPTLGTALPSSIDLRPKAPPVRDQGELGSCTGHGIRALLAFNHPTHDFAPLYIYWEERKLEGTVSEDAGAEIRDGIKACAKVGACEEKFWPYNIARFKRTPSVRANANAGTHKITSYRRLAGLEDVRAALASGQPVVFGFSVYESFESDAVAKTGVVPLPGKHERMLGGHCVAAFGYNDRTQRLTCQNSWGTSWADKGFFTLPYGYVTDRNLSDDYWVIVA